MNSNWPYRYPKFDPFYEEKMFAHCAKNNLKKDKQKMKERGKNDDR